MTNKTTSIGKAASIAVIIMAASNILSRLLGFARIKILAHIGGAGYQMDAYLFAFIIPDMINHFLAGSALSITFIPIFQKHLAKNEHKKAWLFFSNLFLFGSVLFLIFISLSFLYTDKILFFAGNNIKNPETFHLTIKLTRIILPAQIFFFWGALLNGVQYANKHFLLPALTPIIYNLGIIFGGILLFNKFGIAGFSWGVLIGAFVGNVIVQLPGAIKVGLKFFPVINIKDRDLHIYIIKTVPFIAGLTLTFSNDLFLKIFGSYVKNSPGAITTLDFAYKIMFMLVGLFGQSVAAGMFPFLSQLAVEKKYNELNSTLFLLLKRVATILLPVSFLLFILSDHTITLLLQGGKFSSENALIASRNFKFYLVGAYFCASVLIINRAYFSLQKTYTPLILTSLSVIITLPFFFILTNILGTYGVALSISVSSFLMFISLLSYWAYTQKSKGLQQYVIHILKVIIISSISSLTAYLILNSNTYSYIFQFKNVYLKSIINCTIPTIPSLIIILFSYHYLKIFTIDDLKSLILRKKAA